MLYGATFIVLGAHFAWAAAVGGPWWVLAWPAACFVAIGGGYLGLGAGMLAKGSDGKRPRWNWVVFAPYYLLVWVGMRFLRGLSREDSCNEVSPRLYVGRRAQVGEVPAGVTVILDLTAELDVPEGIREAFDYRTLPTLDGAAPFAGPFRTFVEAAARAEGPIYVHCAAGHARSALTAAAILIARGDRRPPDEIVRALRAKRPRIGLSTPQRRLLRRFAREVR